MLGRGTRKGEKFPDKSHFTVFDCFDGTLLEYFRSATAITAEPPEKELRTIKQIIDDVWEAQRMQRRLGNCHRFSATTVSYKCCHTRGGGLVSEPAVQA
jgi:type I site-specific restriction endonuclease